MFQAVINTGIAMEEFIFIVSVLVVSYLIVLIVGRIKKKKNANSDNKTKP